MNDDLKSLNDLKEKRCQSCEGGIPPLTMEQIQDYLKALPEWKLSQDQSQNHNQNSNNQGPVIYRDFEFKNYYKTIAFVNAVAWMAHQENHHPDLTVGYNHCRVQYSTHAIAGLSENDFICAAKIDELIKTA